MHNPDIKESQNYIDHEQRITRLEANQNNSINILLRIENSIVAMDARIEKRIVEMDARIEKRIVEMDNRIEKRFQAVENRMDRMENRMDTGFDSIDKKIDSNFKWTLTMMITGWGITIGGFTGMFALMAHGFHWIK